LPRPLSLVVGSILLTQLPGCERPPPFVYVLQAPQSIELATSASASAVNVGGSLVLHARRTTSGVWKRIESKTLQSDQCWMAVVPPTNEPEVADNLLWRVEPSTGVTFNTNLRANRTREVTIDQPGTYTFSATTGAWCEAGRTVAAQSFTVVVR
jgi:hypothetical protein